MARYSKRLTIRMPEQWFNVLTDLAVKEGRPTSQMLRVILDKQKFKRELLDVKAFDRPRGMETKKVNVQLEQYTYDEIVKKASRCHRTATDVVLQVMVNSPETSDLLHDYYKNQ